MKLKYRIILNILPFMFITFLFVMGVSYYINVTTTLDLIKQILNTRIDSIGYYIIRLEEDRVLKGVPKSELNSYYAKLNVFVMNLLTGKHGYNALIKANGKLFADSAGSLSGTDVRNTEFYKYIFTHKGVVKSNIFEFTYKGVKRIGVFYYFSKWNIYVLFSVSREEYFKPIVKLRNLLIYIFIITSALIIIIIFYLTSIIINPIITVKDKLKQVVETNDFTNKIELSSGINEISELIEASNTLISLFKDILIRLDKEIENFGNLTERSTTVIESVNENFNSFSGNLQNIVATIEVLSSDSEKVTNKIITLEEELDHAKVNLTEGNSIINELNEKTTRMIKLFDEISHSISNISDIAEQTNLLSLNAAIESARAGELGKGFQVVSQEIRDLAYETDKLANTIINMINRTKKDMKSFLESFMQIDTFFISLTERINQIINIHNEIVKGAEFTNTNLNKITDIIGDINQQFEEIFATLNSLNLESRNLSEELNYLKDYIYKFKFKENEIKNNVKQLDMDKEK